MKEKTQQQYTSPTLPLYSLYIYGNYLSKIILTLVCTTSTETRKLRDREYRSVDASTEGK